jgi:hypothetical protein
MNAAMEARLRTWMRRGWLCGGAGLLICALGLVFSRPAAFRAYWFGWVFWSGVGFGSLALLLLQFMTGGTWTRYAQRPAEAGALTIPFMGVLLLPACFGLSHVFPWMHPELWQQHAGPHHKAWLSPLWFIVRSFAYFAIPTAIMLLALFWTHTRDTDDRPAAAGALRGLGAVGAILYVLCMNFASTDWIMSIEPQWTSTIFVYVFVIGQFLTALALTVLLLMLVADDGVHPGLLKPKLMRDYGNLLLAFVMFWAYVSFSQFLIIWSGNLPREISWYLHRREGGWAGFAVFLAAVQFATPFILLLSRFTKQHRFTLGAVAVLIFFANALAVYWQIAPSFWPTAFHIGWLDLAAFLGLGGIWIALFIRAFIARALVPAYLEREAAHV